jgi:hypothetical protein
VLEGVKKTVIAGDPNHLDNLYLYISQGRRTVSIRVQGGSGELGNAVSVSISGDEEWVRGRSGVLRELLEGTQSPLLAGRGHLRPWVAAAGFVAGEILAVLISNPSNPNSSFGNYILLTLALDAALAGGGYFIATLIDCRMRTRLALFPEGPRQKLDPIGLASLIVGILGIIVAVIAILVAHSDAISGH